MITEVYKCFTHIFLEAIHNGSNGVIPDRPVCRHLHDLMKELLKLQAAKPHSDRLL